MADYLTTNWNHKIKTNPVANLILNSNNSGKKIQIAHRGLRRLDDVGKNAAGGHIRNLGTILGEPVWLTENEYNNLLRSGNKNVLELANMSADHKAILRDRWRTPLRQKRTAAIASRRKELRRRARALAKARDLNEAQTNQSLQRINY